MPPTLGNLAGILTQLASNHEGLPGEMRDTIMAVGLLVQAYAEWMGQEEGEQTNHPVRFDSNDSNGIITEMKCMLQESEERLQD